MNASFDPSRFEADLIALLQGELDDAGMERLEYWVQTTPHAASAHLHTMLSQWLSIRRQSRRTIKAHTPPVPDNLRHAIAQMLQSDHPAAFTQPAAAVIPAATDATASSITNESAESAGVSASHQAAAQAHLAHTPHNRPWRLMFYSSAATAAAIILTLGAGLWANLIALAPPPSPITQHTAHRTTLVAAAAEPPVTYAQLSNDRINAFGKRHNTCSRKLEQLYKSNQFPRDLGDMPQAIAGCIGKRPRGNLDLTPAGYKFTQAGECAIPGKTAVHLVYKAESANDSVSLWVVDHDGQPQIEEGVLYQGDPADSPHPIFFWRKGDLVYYLVGNTFGHTRKAATNLLVASR